MAKKRVLSVSQRHMMQIIFVTYFGVYLKGSEQNNYLLFTKKPSFACDSLVNPGLPQNLCHKLQGVLDSNKN